jgi:thymidine kinase
MQGRLELIIGPMFSGKSTELLRRARLMKIITPISLNNGTIKTNNK